MYIHAFHWKLCIDTVCTHSGSCLLWLSQKRRQERGRPPWGRNSWRHLVNRVSMKKRWEEKTTVISYFISFRKFSNSLNGIDITWSVKVYETVSKHSFKKKKKNTKSSMLTLACPVPLLCKSAKTWCIHHGWLWLTRFHLEIGHLHWLAGGTENNFQRQHS